MRTTALRLCCAFLFIALMNGSLLASEERNRAKATLRVMQSVGTAAAAYMVDHNKAPEAPSVDALVPLLTPTYIADLQVKDGWGTPLRYVRTGTQSFQIVSAGSDRKFDQKSWSVEARAPDLATDAVYAVAAKGKPGSFRRTWTSAGAPLAYSPDDMRQLAQPLVDAELEKMKGMSAEESFSYLRTSSTQAVLISLSALLDVYRLKYGRYPAATSIAALEAALYPEFTSEVPKTDRWGTELRYLVSKDLKSYRLVSAGADQTFNEASWKTSGELRSADDDAVIENGALVRTWTTATQPGLGPRAKLNRQARALLERADARAEASDSRGALDAYIEAVKIDRNAADLEAIRRYAGPSFIAAPPPPPPPPPRPGTAASSTRSEAVTRATPPARDDASHIAALRQYLGLHPNHPEASRDLAAVLPAAEAEALAADMIRNRPRDPEVYATRGNIRARTGRRMAAVDDFEKASSLDPGNAERFYIVGVAGYEVVAKDASVSAEQKRALIRRALTALDRAESLRPDYFESLVYRNLLLRQQADLESDAARKQKLIEQADAVRNRARELMKKRRE